MAEIHIPFRDNENDTVTDTSTGLVWQKAPDREAAMSWDDACRFAESLYLGGRSGWRLPSKEELSNLALIAGENPSLWLCDHGFEGIEWELYWTSSKHQKKQDHYWYVDMGTGESGIRSRDRVSFVWAVCNGMKK
jgi:hypothetical protein